MGGRQLYSAPGCKVRAEMPPVRRAGDPPGPPLRSPMWLGSLYLDLFAWKGFLPPHPPPPRHRKQTTAPITRAGERHNLNVLAGKTFGEIIPWFPSPAVAGVSQAGMRGAEGGTWLGKG